MRQPCTALPAHSPSRAAFLPAALLHASSENQPSTLPLLIPPLSHHALPTLPPQRRTQRGDADWRHPDGTPADPAAVAPPLTPAPVVTPSSYPSEIHPALRDEATFQRLSPETAFFAFYFQQVRAIRREAA